MAISFKPLSDHHSIRAGQAAQLTACLDKSMSAFGLVFARLSSLSVPLWSTSPVTVSGWVICDTSIVREKAEQKVLRCFDKSGFIEDDFFLKPPNRSDGRISRL